VGGGAGSPPSKSATELHLIIKSGSGVERGAFGHHDKWQWYTTKAIAYLANNKPEAGITWKIDHKKWRGNL